MALKEPPAGKKGKGLRKLPKAVRNKMGFLKEGGKVMPGMKKRMKKKKGSWTSRTCSSIRAPPGQSPPPWRASLSELRAKHAATVAREACACRGSTFQVRRNRLQRTLCEKLERRTKVELSFGSHRTQSHAAKRARRTVLEWFCSCRETRAAQTSVTVSVP